MIVREAKLKNGTSEQYSALDEAIQTAQFIRNKAVRFWMDNKKVGKANLYTLCKDLAKEFPFAKNVIYPQFLRKSERKLKKAARRLSKKFVKRLAPVGFPDHGSKTRQGAKPQSNNYHKARKRLGRVHLKIQRQRKDWAIKQARNVVMSNDVVVYEDLQIQNMVKNHHLAQSISDASWYQFTRWLEYYGKIWDKAVVAISPAYTSQDCSNCGHRAKKSLSTRTHSCANCGVEICRDTNAAINILKKGMKMLGVEWQRGKCGLGVSPAWVRSMVGEPDRTNSASAAPFQDNGTSGQEESALKKGKHEEKTTSAIDGQLEIVSGLR